MSSDLMQLLGNQVSICMTGNTTYNGVLRDVGEDILVLFNGVSYIYVPVLHVHHVQLNKNVEDHVSLPNDQALKEEQDPISFTKVLTNAKIRDLELSVIGRSAFYGRIVDIQKDYLVFSSPIHKMLLIKLEHIKWFTPFDVNKSPYSINSGQMSMHSSSSTYLPILKNQLKQEVGKLVILDGGVNSLKMGLVKKVENHIIELITANGESIFVNFNHIKSVQIV